MFLGQEDFDLRVREQKLQALSRRVGIERHVCTPRLEDADNADDHLQRPLHAEADPRLGADPKLSQSMGQAARPLVERGVRQLLIGKDECMRRDCDWPGLRKAV